MDVKLDYKESWALKNWCFQTAMLEKTLESPLDCKEIQPVHSKWYQSWIFIGKTDAEAETSIIWPPDVKSPDLWVTWYDSFEKTLMLGKIEGRRRKDNRGWDVWMASPALWTWAWASLRSCDGQRSLVCCSPWSHRVITTELLSWTDRTGSQDLSFWMLSFKPTFSLSFITLTVLSRGSLVLCFLLWGWCHLTYLRLWQFLPAILIPTCASSGLCLKLNIHFLMKIFRSPFFSHPFPLSLFLTYSALFVSYLITENFKGK